MYNVHTCVTETVSKRGKQFENHMNTGQSDPVRSDKTDGWALCMDDLLLCRWALILRQTDDACIRSKTDGCLHHLLSGLRQAVESLQLQLQLQLWSLCSLWQWSLWSLHSMRSLRSLHRMHLCHHRLNLRNFLSKHVVVSHRPFVL